MKFAKYPSARPINCTTNRTFYPDLPVGTTKQTQIPLRNDSSLLTLSPLQSVTRRIHSHHSSRNYQVHHGFNAQCRGNYNPSPGSSVSANAYSSSDTPFSSKPASGKSEGVNLAASVDEESVIRLRRVSTKSSASLSAISEWCNALVGQETFCRQACALPVTLSHTLPSDIKLTRDSDRDQFLLLIHDI